MKKLNIAGITEAKMPKYVEIGTGLYVNRVGKDENGNSCVWVSKGSGRAQKIQLVGTIPNKSDIISQKLNFFMDKNDPDTKASVKAIIDYYNKFMEKEEKSSKTAAMDEKVIKDKLTREFNEVASNLSALTKEVKRTNLEKDTISQIINWAIDALNKANTTLQALDTKPLLK